MLRSGAHPTKEHWTALRDYPYIALTLLDSVLAIQLQILTIAIPLWLTSHTRAPRWILFAIVVLNTVMVVLFQVRASKRISNAQEAGQAMRRRLALMLSCILISVTGHLPAVQSGLLLLAAVMIQTVGELWYSAGGFEFLLVSPPRRLRDNISVSTGWGWDWPTRSPRCC